MAKPVEVTDAEFDQLLAQNPLVLVDFWAEWCAPCRMIAPILEELAQEYEGRVVVAKLDVDENPKTAMRYRVMSIPTVILFKGGQPVEVLVGAQPKRNFEAKLQKHLPPSA
ncbi:thioredoxin [Thermus oshimai]|jgi:thioredoxin 1|uniref:Thioredoxin n=1 Tax=Thermus oshimai JL-2 TaxID=751945 RepID=K7R7N6_THEOS|nr:thioredoxin [Thermus oshimai]AFV77029.1 thioredoxin [Thermus oshimai JL-2]